MKLIEVLLNELPKNGGWPNSEHVRYAFRSKGVDDYFFGTAPTIVHPGDEMVLKTEYEAALAASKQPEWDGEGSPPVGVTCEHRPGDGTTENAWEVVTVLGISERPGGIFTDFWLRKEDGSSYIVRNAYRFRPIRTEAERKRELTIRALQEWMGQGYSATQIYDLAIAKGEIPGIRLTDDPGN